MSMKKIYFNLHKCLGCKNCEIACGVEHSLSKQLFSAINEFPLPLKRVSIFSAVGHCIPIRCLHCEDALCLFACKSGAISKDDNTGRVIIDSEKCIGCWMCIMVCPIGAIYINEIGKTAVKCDLCAEKEIPACVLSCPTGALFYK